MYKKNEITINTEYIRLDQLLKFSGLCTTGGEASVMIKEGEVLLNGETCLMRGKKIRIGDHVQFKNEVVVVVDKK